MLLDAYGDVDIGDPLDWSHPLAYGLAGAWVSLPPLDGSLSLYDLTGANVGALTNGPTWVTAPNGLPAVNYDGSNGYTLVRSGRILSGLSAWTMCAMVRTTAPAYPTGSGSGRAVYCERAASGVDILKLDTLSTFIPTWGLTIRNDGSTLLQKAAGTAINDGVWHTLAITLSGTTVSLYTDGRPDGTGVWSGSNTFTDAGAESRIGGDAGDPISRFQGPIGPVLVYTRALSATDVLNLNDEVTAGLPTMLNRRRATWMLAGGGGATFNPAWAYRSTVVLGGAF